MTLLELVISLAIVAALSAVVLDNFSDTEMRERERQTVERGERVRRAMTGADEKDGISRFLSDMGRWPKVTVKNDANGERNHRRNLAQLYDRSVFYHSSETKTMFNRPAEITVNHTVLGIADPGLEDYAFPKVALNVGWSGPYLNLLKTDGAAFPDAWGKSWKIVKHYFLKTSGGTLIPDNTAVAETASQPDGETEIDGIVSYGADDAAGGAEPADLDHEFIFAHDLNLATLTVTLKARDDFNPAVWRDLKPGDAASAAEYNQATAAASGCNPGDVVYCLEGSARHYYTCLNTAAAAATANDATVGATGAPYNSTGDYTAVNGGWRYGVPSHWVSADGVSVLLFAPARREISGDPVMEAGFFRLIPWPTGAARELRFPPLRYCHEASGGTQTIGTDADATADGEVDEDVASGSERNTNRLRAKLEWEYTSGSLPSTFRASWLVPGRRRIYAFAGFYYGGIFVSGMTSPVESIDLKPGNNYVTLYLERVK